MTRSRLALVAWILAVVVGIAIEASAAPKIALIEVKGMVCAA
jgi:hypothetical protein